jgi:hypothetical protein
MGMFHPVKWLDCQFIFIKIDDFIDKNLIFLNLV